MLQSLPASVSTFGRWTQVVILGQLIAMQDPGKFVSTQALAVCEELSAPPTNADDANNSASNAGKPATPSDRAPEMTLHNLAELFADRISERRVTKLAARYNHASHMEE